MGFSPNTPILQYSIIPFISRDPFPPQADQPQAETSFARSGLLLARRVGRNCGIRIQQNFSPALTFLSVQVMALGAMPVASHGFDGSSEEFQPPPRAWTRSTAAVMRWPRIWTAVVSFVSAIVCAVITLR
jgi:NAD(P)H-dependent FMN reductase